MCPGARGSTSLGPGFPGHELLQVFAAGPIWNSRGRPEVTQGVQRPPALTHSPPPPLAAGNAGMAAAYAARKLGIPATIVVPNTTPALTIERLKDEGATVKVVGEVSADLGQGPQRVASVRGGSPGPSPLPTSPVVLQMLDEALELAQALAKNNPGWVFIPPFDDPLIWYVKPRVSWWVTSSSYTTGWAPATRHVVTLSCTAVTHVCTHHHVEAHTHAPMPILHGQERTRAQIHRRLPLDVPGADPKAGFRESSLLVSDSLEEWRRERRKGRSH